MIKVVEFSKKTGDYSNLSETDIRILALTCKIHRENGGNFNEEPGMTRPYQNRAKIDEWITPESFKSNDGRVSLVSYDFSIQNAALQMGLKLLSPLGIEIKHLKLWAKRCKSCMEVCEDVEKEFCPHCGNHSLYRVSYAVDLDGKTTYYEPKKKKNALQGTVFPIPNPKGGKNSNDLILREDQLFLMGGRQNKWNWKKPKAYDSESLEFFGYDLKAKSGFKYGPSKKNPNEARKKKH